MSKQKKIVFHSIDSPRRELEWRLFVAIKLAEKGFTNIIGSKTEIEYLHENSRNCVFLGRLNSVTGRTKSDIRYLKRMEVNGTKMFYLHDEGGFYFRGEYDEAVKKIYPDELFGSSAIHNVFFWGEKQRRVFENHKNYSKLHVTGSPRFDLLKSGFSHIDSEYVKSIKERYGKFVLVCTRFGAVNRVPDEPTTLSKRSFDIRVEGGALKKFSKEEIFETMFSAWEKISYEFTSFVPTLAKLVQDFPDVNFVIRPHPAERQSFYSDSFAHFNNVFVDKSGDVRPFIRASEVVIHSECTTGVEAEIAGRPTINFRPCMNIEKYAPFSVEGVSNVGLLCCDYESLYDSLQSALSGQSQSNDSLHNAAPYLANVMGNSFAFERIVQMIDEFCGARLETSHLPILPIRSRFQFIRYIKNKLRTFRDLVVNAAALKKGDSKFYYYSDTELQRFLKNVSTNDVKIWRKGRNIWVAPKRNLYS